MWCIGGAIWWYTATGVFGVDTFALGKVALQFAKEDRGARFSCRGTARDLQINDPNISVENQLHRHASSNAQRRVVEVERAHMWLQRAKKNGLRTEARLIQRCIQQNHSHRQLSIPRSLKKKQDPLVRDDPPVEQNGAPKLPPRKTSLRRVGLEAERSRVVVRHRGGVRVIDPDVQTKVYIQLPNLDLYTNMCRRK